MKENKTPLLFVVISKSERLIKQNKEGMLCIFSKKRDAIKFIKSLHRDYVDDCEIVEKEMLFK